MIGSQIKYEPAWVNDLVNKEQLKILNAQECLSSTSAGLSTRSLSRIRNNLRNSMRNQANFFDNTQLSKSHSKGFHRRADSNSNANLVTTDAES